VSVVFTPDDSGLPLSGAPVADGGPAAVLPAPRAAPGLARAAAAARGAARRFPVAAAGTALVAAGALAPAAPLLSAVDDTAAADVALATPWAYVAFSPFTRLADLLCLLSTAQHAALAATLLAAAAAWKVARRCPHASALRTCARATGACVLSLVAFVVLLAGAVFAPRPMASLATTDADEVRVDFHTHTNASHDVPTWFTPERRRAWHVGAGYDLAYVSDHKGVAGALAAARGNPARPGDGLVVLPAIESWWRGIHVVVLGDPALDRRCSPTSRPTAPSPRPGRRAPRRAPGAGGDRRDPRRRARRAHPGRARLRAVAARRRGGRRRAARHRPARPRGRGHPPARGRLGIVPVAPPNHHGWGDGGGVEPRARPGLACADARGARRAPRGRAPPRRRGGGAGGDAGRPVVAPARPARAASLVATLPAVLMQARGGAHCRRSAAWLAGCGRRPRGRPAPRPPPRLRLSRAPRPARGARPARPAPLSAARSPPARRRAPRAARARGR
jgi:hypothetical protein